MKNLIIGMAAMVLCMIADWFLDVKGAGNISHGIVESNWTKMSLWRFEVSILIGAFVVPFYWFGIREMMSMAKENCNVQSKMSRFMSKLFCISAMAGVISFVFIHIMCCLFPIIFKSIYAVYPDFNLTTSIVNTIAKYIYTPFFVYYAIADFGISISWIYMTFNKQFNIGKWAVICCPLSMMVIVLLIKLIPFQPLHDVSVAFETLGYVLLLFAGYLHCNNKKRYI